TGSGYSTADMVSYQQEEGTDDFEIAAGDFNGDHLDDLIATDPDYQVTNILVNGATADPSVSSLSFSAADGTLSAAPQGLIHNNGFAPLMLNGFSASSGDFSTGATTCGAPVPSGGSCSVDVIYHPQAGSTTAKLTIDANTETNSTVSLTGTASPLPTGPAG